MNTLMRQYYAAAMQRWRQQVKKIQLSNIRRANAVTAYMDAMWQKIEAVCLLDAGLEGDHQQNLPAMYRDPEVVQDLRRKIERYGTIPYLSEIEHFVDLAPSSLANTTFQLPEPPDMRLSMAEMAAVVIDTTNDQEHVIRTEQVLDTHDCGCYVTRIVFADDSVLYTVPHRCLPGYAVLSPLSRTWMAEIVLWLIGNGIGRLQDPTWRTTLQKMGVKFLDKATRYMKYGDGSYIVEDYQDEDHFTLVPKTPDGEIPPWFHSNLPSA